MHNFRKLNVWIKAIKLVKPVYALANKFPIEEKFSLISQVKRAVTSISANIAEGAGRGTQKDFERFLSIAQGSCFEVENHLIVAETLDFISLEELELILPDIHEIQRMLNAMITRN